MRVQTRTSLLVWTGTAGVHGLLAWGLALKLAPVTTMIDSPAMSVELAEVLGGEVRPRPTPAPLPAAEAKAAEPPRTLEVQPPIFRAVNSEVGPPAPAMNEPQSVEMAATDTPAAAAAATPAAPQMRHGVAKGLDVDAPHGAGRDYPSKLRSWLESHKTYPKKARMRREEGVVEVRFALDRSGHVLAGAVVRTSGHPLLDAEVIAMLGRADPFPPAPSHVRGDRIEIAAPVEFFLSR